MTVSSAINKDQGLTFKSSDNLKTLLFAFFTIGFLFYAYFRLDSASVCIFFMCIVALLFKYKERFFSVFLSFFIGVTILILFYEYNLATYENHFFFGKYSDDYLYEVIDSRDFYNNSGLNALEIYETLSILHNSVGYVYLLTLLRFFGDFFDGYHTFLPRLLNLFLLQLCAQLIYRIGVSLYQLPVATMKKIAFWFSIFPALLFIAINIFRDIVVATLILSVFYYCNRERTRWNYVLYVIFFCLILFFLRKFALYVILLLLPIYFFKVKKINTTMLGLIGIGALGFWLVIGEYLADVIAIVERYDTLNKERLGGLATSIFQLPKYIGIFPRISYLLLNPVPGFANLEQFFSSFGVYFQIICLPYIYLALIKPSVDLRLKLTFILLFIGIALSTINFRHITMYLPFAFILFAFSKKELTFFSKKYTYLLVGLLFYIFTTLIIAQIL